MQALGARGVPVTVIGQTVIRGYDTAALAEHLEPLGYRLVSQTAQMTTEMADRLLNHFGSLHAMFGANRAELAEVPGIGPARARAIRDGLARMSDSLNR